MESNFVRDMPIGVGLYTILSVIFRIYHRTGQISSILNIFINISLEGIKCLKLYGILNGKEEMTLN